MSKYRKAGFLIALLVIPVFIFLFLKGFTTNHFDLPYLRPLMESGNVIRNTQGDTLYRAVAGWSFTNGSDTVTERKLRGKYVVVGRMLDSSDVAARKVVANLGRIRILTGSLPDLRLVTLTNAVGEVQQILEEFESVDDGWSVWGSDKEQLVWIADDLDSGMSDDQKTIPTNNRLVLLDKAGFVRGYYNGLQPAEIDRLLAEIKILDYSDSLKK